jgi:hypothetical protein
MTEHSGSVTEHSPGPPSPWDVWLAEHRNEFDPQDWVEKLQQLGPYRSAQALAGKIKQGDV